MKNFPPRRALCLIAAGFLFAGCGACAQEAVAASPWTQADSKLANHYINLLQRDPSYGKVLDLLWQLYAKKEQTPLLLDYFKKASAEGPAVARLIHAHLLRKSGDLDAARGEYDAVIEAEPDNVPALTALAGIADEQKRWAKALSLYNRLAELTPAGSDESLSIRKRRADLLRLQGQPAEAAAEWKTLLADYPDRAELRSEITGLLLEAGETETAATLLQDLAKSGDNRVRLEALVELNRLHEFSGNFEAGVATAREAMTLLHFRSPEYGKLFAGLVRYYERFDRLGELEESLSAAAAGVNPAEQALVDLVSFYGHTADPVKEEAAVARLAASLPGNVEIRLHLAELQMRNDRYEEAATTLDSLVAEGQTPTLAWLLRRSLVDLQAKGREAATQRLRDALAKGAIDADGRRDVLEFARRHYLDDLVESLLGDSALPGSSDSESSAPVELGRFLHERGRVDQAIATLKAYAGEAGGGKLDQAARLHQIGVVFKELGLDGEAREALERALELAPENLEYRSALADVLVAAKQIDEAIAELERVREGRDGLKDRAEIDQRLFSLLRGHFSSASPVPPADDSVLSGGTIQSLAQYRRLAAAANQQASSAGDEPPPPELVAYYEAIKKAANDGPSTEKRYRAAWWAMKLQDNQECFHQLTKANEEAGKPVAEVEKMLLTLAEQNERTTLMVRHLATLIEIDPENADDYRQRRALVRFELGFEDEAVRELKELAAKPDAPLATLNALAKLYQRQGSPGKQVEVWQRAFRDADLFEKRNIIKQLSSAYIESGRPEEALRAQIELLESESDPVQRRKQLDAQITVAQTHYLLDWMRDRYSELSARHPFDRFYPEALARVLRAGNHEREAYAAMKKAYYLSGQNEELLGDLGELSDRLGDLDSAIYFRRQLLAIGQGESVDDWKVLLRMLEKDLRVTEADDLRRRLETKFGSDADFLAELTDHYLKTGQPRDAERTLASLVSLRSWDLEARFRLGLLQSLRQEPEEAFATFAKILADTEGQSGPKGFGEGMLPLIRVAADPGSPRGAPGDGLEPFVFTVEAYPYTSGTVQDDIADALQEERAEFAPVPKEPHLIRLRAIEEAGALASRLGRVPAWLADRNRDGQPIHERLWATRHAGGDSEAARQAFADLLVGLAKPETPLENLTRAYCWLLSADRERFQAWVGDTDDDEAGPSRKLYGAMAALLLVKNGSGDPLYDFATVESAFAGLDVSETVAAHVFDELRKEERYRDAFRLGETFAAKVLSDAPSFHFELSRVAGLAGLASEREKWLDRSLFEGIQERRGRMGRHTYTALTERLALLDTDAERADCLQRFALATAGAFTTPREALERDLYLSLAAKDTESVLERLGDLVNLRNGPMSTIVADPADRERAWMQNWQELNRLLLDYRDRMQLDAAQADAFAEAFAVPPPMQQVEGTTAAAFEQLEIDRQLVRLEHRNPAERGAILRDLRAFIREPDSRLELAKALESRGYHREAVPVFLDDAGFRERDYAPLQGLFDAAAEAFDPEPALAAIARIHSGDFPAPPGLTVDYLNDKHARFLLTSGDLERLERFGQAQAGSANSPPVSSRSHLPYQDALVEAYRRFEKDDALLALLGKLRDAGEATQSQILLGAETLAGLSRYEEAFAWLEPVALDPTEPTLQRRALRLAVAIHLKLPGGAGDSMRDFALASFERQPVPVSLELAGAMHAAGAGEDAVSVLRLLRRQTPNPARRLDVSMELLRAGQMTGKSWNDLRDDLESVFLDLGTKNESGSKRASRDDLTSASPAELPQSPTYRFVSWLLSVPSGNLAETLESASCTRESGLLRDLLLAHLRGRLATQVRSALADAARGEGDEILELLPAFGETGVKVARESVEADARPGTSYFPGSPERQIAFFHRIGDRIRLLEVHSERIREAGSDIFHQSGLEDWQPTLASRRHLPALFAAAGEPALARSLYRAYDDAIASYHWPHVAFLNDYADFLIRNGAFEDAEVLLHRVLRKSLRIDLRLLPRLYGAWGRLDEWEARTRPLELTTGQDVLIRHWAAALAAGREMREIRDPW